MGGRALGGTQVLLTTGEQWQAKRDLAGHPGRQSRPTQGETEKTRPSKHYCMYTVPIAEINCAARTMNAVLMAVACTHAAIQGNHNNCWRYMLSLLLVY